MKRKGQYWLSGHTLVRGYCEGREIRSAEMDMSVEMGSDGPLISVYSGRVTLIEAGKPFSGTLMLLRPKTYKGTGLSERGRNELTYACGLSYGSRNKGGIHAGSYLEHIWEVFSDNLDSAMDLLDKGSDFYRLVTSKPKLDFIILHDGKVALGSQNRIILMVNDEPSQEDLGHAVKAISDDIKDFL